MNQQDESELLLGGFGGATKVRARVADIAWLTEFFSPSLTPQVATIGCDRVVAGIDRSRFDEWKLRFQQSPTRRYECFTLDGRFESYAGCETADGSLLISLDDFGLMMRADRRGGEFELVGGSDRARLRVGLMRVIRELATVRALRSGAIPLHGAVCEYGGAAIALLGPKTAGKTTSLLHWLQTPGTRFVANDRFFLESTAAGWIVRGMPTIVKIRAGTRELFGDLDRRLRLRRYHFARALTELPSATSGTSTTSEISGTSGIGEPSYKSAEAHLSQAQFLAATDRTAVTAVPLRMLLFVDRDDTLEQPEFVSMAAADIAAGLIGNLLTPGPRLRTAEVFDDAADREIAATVIGDRCHDLAATACGYRYRQGRLTLGQTLHPPRHRAAA